MPALPLPELPMRDLPAPDVRYRYQTLDLGGTAIHVRTLWDRQQFSDNSGVAARLGISSAAWPLFGLIWASGEVLARLMVSYEVAGKRILEVGCGIGLASLVLNQRMADITATDIHPEAGRFIRENTRINQGRPIPFVRTGWSDAISELGCFDLIIGSDLLYERAHVIPLAGFIHQHAGENCEVILIDPGRGHHAPFSKKMVSLGYSHSQARPVYSGDVQSMPRGQVLHYQRTSAL
jgi:predicted nicotinamide N-methyase